MEHFFNTIPGWFTWHQLYWDMVRKFPSGSIFVEVGIYQGCSLAFLIVEMINANKEFKIIGVDSLLLGKTVADGLLGKFNFINKNSVDAACDFEDKSLDFVFIDASHTYESVKEDILAWTPKIKQGGIIAGHDYPFYLGVKQAVDEMFGEKICKDYINEGCWLIKIK